MQQCTFIRNKVPLFVQNFLFCFWEVFTNHAILLDFLDKHSHKMV